MFSRLILGYLQYHYSIIMYLRIIVMCIIYWVFFPLPIIFSSILYFVCFQSGFIGMYLISFLCTLSYSITTVYFDGKWYVFLMLILQIFQKAEKHHYPNLTFLCIIQYWWYCWKFGKWNGKSSLTQTLSKQFLL